MTDHSASDVRLAAVDLLTDLSWALDTGDADRFAGAFAPDADFVLEAGPELFRVAGRDALVADFAARRPHVVAGTQHRMSNHLFTPRPDGTWDVWSYWATSTRDPETGTAQFAGSGWTCDRVQDGPEGWRIVHHHVAGWRDEMVHPLAGASCC